MVRTEILYRCVACILSLSPCRCPVYRRFASKCADHTLVLFIVYLSSALLFISVVNTFLEKKIFNNGALFVRPNVYRHGIGQTHGSVRTGEGGVFDDHIRATGEKVVNPYGSTAGAGSGEFHIYRQARAREMQRQAQLQLSAQEQAAAREFEEQRQRDAEECAARTEKRKRKREKQKEAKLRKRNLEQAGIVVEKVEAEEPTAEEEEEFVYISEPKEDVTTEKDGDESALNNAKATLESSRSEGAS